MRILFSTEFLSIILEDDLNDSRLVNYRNVYNLKPAESFNPIDVLQFSIMADLMMRIAVVSDWLDEKIEITDNMENRISGFLLHHILQLINNGQTVYLRQSYNFTIEQVNIGSALLPNFAMFNHSCLPNVLHSYENGKIVVRANKDIKAGSQLFNCYGAQAGHMSLWERKQVIKQYGFICDCDACGGRVEIDNKAYGQYMNCNLQTDRLDDNQELLIAFVVQFLFAGSKALPQHHNLLEIVRRKIYYSPLMTTGDLKYFGNHLVLQSCERSKELYGNYSIELANNYSTYSLFSTYCKDIEKTKAFGEKARKIYKKLFGENNNIYLENIEKIMNLIYLTKRLF